MKYRRIAAALLWLLGIGAVVLFARDPLFWKRYVLAAIFSPAQLPDAFYEPSEMIAGGNEPAPPRVEPELERIDPAALQAAAEYAGVRHTTALIVARHGHIVFERYWDGGNYGTVTDLGAFNATLAALMVGMAMGDHKIGLLEEPAANYIESYRGTGRAAITLADLLHSESGLRAGQGIGPGSSAARERFGRDLVQNCLARDAARAPGFVWISQPCDVQLIAHVVERATGRGYAGYISQSLWKPIGAADARLSRTDEAGAARADCCLRARRGDWMRIGELLVSDGHFQGEQLLPPGWVRGMLAPSKRNPAFGMQVWIGRPATAQVPGSMAGALNGSNRTGTGTQSSGDAGDGAVSEPYAAHDLYLLKGNGKSRLWFVPSLSLTILRTGTNAQSDRDWDDARVPNLIVRGTRDFVPPALPPEPLRNLVPSH